MNDIAVFLDYFEYAAGKLLWRVERKCRGGHTKIGEEAGYIGGNGYRYVGVGGRHWLAHRVIFAMHHGRWPEKHLDHINRMPTDNRVENLRECTQRENAQNASLRSDNTTGVKGVYWDKTRRRYVVELMVNGKKKSLGRAKTLEEAAAKRAAGEAKFHPFACR